MREKDGDYFNQMARIIAVVSTIVIILGDIIIVAIEEFTTYRFIPATHEIGSYGVLIIPFLSAAIYYVNSPKLQRWLKRELKNRE